MNPQNRQLFVIIVHYGQPFVTQGALEALWSGKSAPTAVMVIDHGKTPFLRADARRTHIIRPAVNAGYGAGVNLGAQKARGEYLFVLNPDTLVFPDTLSKLVNFLDKYPLAGIVAPMLLDSQKKPYPWVGTHELTPLQGILSHSFINKFWPRHKPRTPR